MTPEEFEEFATSLSYATGRALLLGFIGGLIAGVAITLVLV